MPGLAAGNAFLDGERVLNQHQAALTLLQRVLSDPAVKLIRWLDLACGKGQILGQIDQNVSLKMRSKIHYVGIDLNVDFARITERTTASLGFAGARVEVGELARFDEVIGPSGDRYDFITLTNTIHEIAPNRLPTIIFDCFKRLTGDGTLFVYDMERLPAAELGAVPWTADEMEQIIASVLSGAGVTAYSPAVGRWKHASCTGWNALIEMRHILKEVDDLLLRRANSISTGAAKITEIIERRRTVCADALESLTRYGSSTSNERGDEIAALYEYWALSRMVEGG